MADSRDEKIRLQEELISALHSQLNDRETTIRDLNRLIEELKSTIANLNESIDEFRRKFFGTSSEKTQRNTATADDEVETSIVKTHTRKKHAPKRTRDGLSDRD